MGFESDLDQPYLPTSELRQKEIKMDFTLNLTCVIQVFFWRYISSMMDLSMSVPLRQKDLYKENFRVKYIKGKEKQKAFCFNLKECPRRDRKYNNENLSQKCSYFRRGFLQDFMAI